MIKTTSGAALCGLLLATPQLGSAALKPECPTVATPIIVANDGNVVATYVGSAPNVAYDDKLYLDQVVVNGAPVAHDHVGEFLFGNKTSTAGTAIDLGTFKAGTELVFRLDSASTTGTFSYFTGAVSNDGYPHARVTPLASGEDQVDFEDLIGRPECDVNNPKTPFTDLSFSFTNVQAPPPTSPTSPSSPTSPPTDPSNPTVTPSGKTVALPDSFLSYKSSPAKVPAKTFTWADALGNSGQATINKAANLANPASVARSTINSADVSLEGYELKKAPKMAASVAVSNYLGNWTLQTVKPERFLAPASVDRVGLPTAPVLDNQGIVDDFVCYSTKGAASPKGATVLLKDELNGSNRTYKVLKATRLCAPAATQGGTIQRPGTYLMCYLVKPKGVKPASVKGVKVNSLLVGANRVNAVQEDEYCVPSTVSR